MRNPEKTGDWKYLPVERLITLLKRLPKGSGVKVNKVGNLFIFNTETAKSIAYIDFVDNGEIGYYDESWP